MTSGAIASAMCLTSKCANNQPYGHSAMAEGVDPGFAPAALASVPFGFVLVRVRKGQQPRKSRVFRVFAHFGSAEDPVIVNSAEEKPSNLLDFLGYLSKGAI